MLVYGVGGIVFSGVRSQTIGVFIALAAIFAPFARGESAAAAIGAAGASIAGSIGAISAANSAANADMYINGLQIEAAKYQVDRYSRLSEYQALLGSQTALALGGIQAWMNSFNQGQVTNRLSMQLAEIRASSNLRQQMDRERLQKEYSLRNRELDLQEKAMNAQYSLALAAAGGPTTFFSSLNSGNFLPTRYGLAKANTTLTTTPAADRLLSSLQQVSSLQSRITSSGSILSRVPRGVPLDLSKALVRGSSRTVRLALRTVPRAVVRGMAASADWRRHESRETARALESVSGHHHAHAAH